MGSICGCNLFRRTKKNLTGFKLMVKSGGGSENANEYINLNRLVTKKFPNSSIIQEIDPSLGVETFEISLNNDKFYSKKINGKVNENKESIRGKINMILNNM